jgi:hypothetical protein
MVFFERLPHVGRIGVFEFDGPHDPRQGYPDNDTYNYAQHGGDNDCPARKFGGRSRAVGGGVVLENETVSVRLPMIGLRCAQSNSFDRAASLLWTNA